MIQRYSRPKPFLLPDDSGDFVKFFDVRTAAADALNTTKAMRTRTDEVVMVALINQLESTLKQIGGLE